MSAPAAAPPAPTPAAPAPVAPAHAAPAPVATFLPRTHTNRRITDPPRHHSRFAAATLVRRAIEASAQRHFPPIAPATFVDFGCGSMPYRPLFEPYASEYLGIDLPGNAAARLTLRPDGTADVPDASADVVISTQVLEHVPDPQLYLAEARRMLRPGGMLSLSTHGYWHYHPDPNDYHRWTGPGLQRLVELAGFETVEFTGIMGLLPTGLQLASDGLVRKVLSRRARRWLGPTFALLTQTPILWLDRLHTDEQRRQDAAAFLIVARRSNA